nr:uncharacterized protein C12orf73 homolog isoform X1 [Camelus dromedarius]XP_031318765.1 uncharacterized protein C12orf73 homolog isoform X1 [Camelus dromedarius]XP_031318766.1 uncharacterized protein C12orf73 homolog isoform X1 [Camelus dromedarius]XP_031318767.1 uncharacterized protein C12orf73 homolog isoform X1 [Camelus dromedarius]XP_031318768.1 uncharacterized protein C12orf73 homolog isoform X1 [Camelus dromedarius]XP_031318769.1 uncharacterized protein C12orf73 homolog isoform X1 [Ca
MPAGVSWTSYLKMFAASLLAMCAGAQAVHRYYQPDLKRNMPRKDRHTGRMPDDNRGKDWSEQPQARGHHQKLGRGKEGFSRESQSMALPTPGLQTFGLQNCGFMGTP